MNEYLANMVAEKLEKAGAVLANLELASININPKDPDHTLIGELFQGGVPVLAIDKPRALSNDGVVVGGALKDAKIVNSHSGGDDGIPFVGINVKLGDKKLVLYSVANPNKLLELDVRGKTAVADLRSQGEMKLSDVVGQMNKQNGIA